MRVKIIKNQPGSPDGVTVIDYRAGQVYDMPDHLAVIFIRENWAVTDRPLPGPSHTKPEGPTSITYEMASNKWWKIFADGEIVKRGRGQSSLDKALKML